MLYPTVSIMQNGKSRGSSGEADKEQLHNGRSVGELRYYDNLLHDILRECGTGPLPTTFTASELESEYGGVSLEPVTYDLTMLDSRE